MLPGTGVEPPRKPEQDLSKRLVVGEEQEDGGHDSAKKCVDRDARKQERRHREVPPNGGNAVDQEGGRDGAPEGEGRQGEKEEAGHPGGNGDDRTHGGPGGDADDPRVGHRVAEKALHRRSRHAQGRAD